MEAKYLGSTLIFLFRVSPCGEAVTATTTTSATSVTSAISTYPTSCYLY